MYLSRMFLRRRMLRYLLDATIAFGTTGLALVAGCSSGGSSAKPQVGPVAFSDANGAPQKALTALTVSQGTYLEVSLPTDPKQLGADWSVACGSALPPGTPLPPGQTQDQSCGTFTPGHTISGPVPSYAAGGAGYVTFYAAPPVPPKQGLVTLYASATADPTKFSSVTLAINGLPISVGFAPAPPASIGLSESSLLKAVLDNDVTNAGVNWTVLCGSPDCGSFTPRQTASGVETTYHSPAAVPIGGFVKLSATAVADPNQTVSAAVQILPIAVSVSPGVLNVTAAGSSMVTATLANDGLAKGVDWSLSCTNALPPGNCGTITTHTASGEPATYTAPDAASIAVGITVTLLAASTTDPVQSATAVATIVQGSVASRSVEIVGPKENARETL